MKPVRGFQSIGLMLLLVACAKGGSYPTQVAATVYSEQTRQASLPTAKPTRTPTSFPTVATTPTPVLGGFPPSSGIPISASNVEDLTLLGVLEPEWPYVFLGPTAVEYSPDGRLLAVGTPHSVTLLDAISNKALAINKFENGVTALAFSPDSQILAIGTDGKIVLFDLLAERSYAVLDPQDDLWLSVSDILYSSNGEVLLSALGDQIYRWDIETGQIIETLGLPQEQTGQGLLINQVIFTPRDELILFQACEPNSFDPYSVYESCSLWVRESNASDEFEELPPWVNWISFSEDGSLAVQISMFGGSTITNIGDATSEDLHILSASFSPDGIWLVTSMDDGKLYLWGIP